MATSRLLKRRRSSDFAKSWAKRAARPRDSEPITRGFSEILGGSLVGGVDQLREVAPLMRRPGAGCWRRCFLVKSSACGDLAQLVRATES